MNAATGSNQRLRDTEFQNFICSIQYGQLQLQSTLDDVLGECLYLIMLAFLTATFQIPGTKVRYPYLVSRFRECCCAGQCRDAPAARPDALAADCGRHLCLWRRRAVAARALAGRCAGPGVA